MTKKFIEYPIAMSYDEAVQHLENGGGLWVEYDTLKSGFIDNVSDPRYV